MTEQTGVVIDHADFCIEGPDHEHACRDPLTAWEGDAEDTKPVLVGKLRVLVVRPNDEQVAVLVRFSRFEQNTRGDAKRQAAMINRVGLLASELCADYDDWAEIEDRLTTHADHPDHLTWADVNTMLADMVKVWYADQNRETRRATKRTARRVRR